MNMLEEIEKKVNKKEPLNEGERAFLVQGIFDNYLKDDNPKYDQANMEWLNSLPDELICKKYREHCVT